MRTRPRSLRERLCNIFMKLEGERDYSEIDSGVLAHLKGKYDLTQH